MSRKSALSATTKALYQPIMATRTRLTGPNAAELGRLSIPNINPNAKSHISKSMPKRTGARPELPLHMSIRALPEHTL
eukprot:6085862-Amphidinium_carterae.1